jgi:hypothetical protein
MNGRILACSLLAVIFLFVIELVRQERLTFKYASGWLLISFVGILLAVFDGLLASLSKFFGFELLSNFVFFVMLGGFVFLSLFMTILLCQQNDRNERIAQKLGILENEIEKMKK